MKTSEMIAAFTLPPNCYIDQRVPKKMLVEHGAPTASDKRLINEGIDELFWHAALKPANIGVPAHRDSVREYIEIEILCVALRQGANQKRITELIHRAVPYPVVLIATTSDGTSLSLAHKRWSQGESGKVVVEDVYQTRSFSEGEQSQQKASFLSSLALAQLSRENLHTLYQSWHDRVTALAASQITGTFKVPDNTSQGTALRSELDNYKRLQRDIAFLRALAIKERQLNRRVELNNKIRMLEAELLNTKHLL